MTNKKVRNKYTSSKRLMTILNWLEKGEKVSYERITNHFGIKRAQARSDLEVLRDFRTIEEYREGRKKFFKMGCSRTKIPSLIARSAMLEFGNAALDILRGTIFGEEATALVEEFKNLLPEKETIVVDRITQSFYHRHAAGPHNAKKDALEDILTSLHYQKVLSIEYLRLYDGSQKKYNIEPLALVLWKEQLQLIAIKLESEKLRSFDLDGIVHTKVLNAKYERPEDFDVGSLYQFAIGRYIDCPVIDVKLKVRGDWITYFKRRNVHSSQRIEEVEGGLIVFLKVGDCPDLRSWIISMIPDVRVEEPIQLKKEIKEMLKDGNSFL